MKYFIALLLALPFTVAAQVDTLVGSDKTTSFTYDIDTSGSGLVDFIMRWTDVIKYTGDVEGRAFGDYKIFADTNALNDFITQLQAEYDALNERATRITEEADLKAKRIKAFENLRDSVIRGMHLPVPIMAPSLFQVDAPPQPDPVRCRMLAIIRRRKYKSKK